MEINKVKILREKYGIGDSRNVYTEEDIENAANSRAYYFSYKIDDASGKITFEKRLVYAYVSKDNCIWLKDEEINEGYKCYMPKTTINTCETIEEGIYYHNNMYCYDTYYCFNKDFNYCLSLVKKSMIKDIIECISEKQNIINKLLCLIEDITKDEYSNYTVLDNI